MKILVEKNTGKTERFSLYKLYQSILRAGGNATIAQHVAGRAAHILHDSVKNGKTTANEIKAKVAALLKKANAKVAESYQKFKK